MPKRSKKPRAVHGRRVREQARDVYREAILDAAEHAFAASGFHGAHMQAIAQRAGLAVGTIYNYFGQKEDVLLALLEQRLTEVIAVLGPAKDEPTNYEKKLTLRLERVLDFKERHVAFLTLASELGLLGEPTSAARQLIGDRSIAQTTQLQGVWLKLIDEGVDAKILAPLDRELLAGLLKSTFRTVSRWSHDHAPSLTTSELARMIVDLFLHGQGAIAQPTRRRRAS